MFKLSYRLLITILFLVPFFVSAHDGGPILVHMNADGFDPREITIEEGESVIFINNDTVDRWPASNFHPAHTIYPEFDSKKPVLPNESWKFKFDKAGTWRMHDHLKPHLTGTVIVLENASTSPMSPEPKQGTSSSGVFSRIAQFFSNLWDQIFHTIKPIKIKKGDVEGLVLADDKIKYIENFATLNSPETAWLLLKDAYNKPEGVVGNPHDQAHLIGGLLYEKNGIEGISTCDSTFAFGCYHGLMDRVLAAADKNNLNPTIIEAREGCSSAGEVMNVRSCIHGIGHGLATLENYDIKKALNDCDLLAPEDQTYCSDGMFMEAMNTAPPSLYDPKKPTYPCDTLEEKYVSSCARSLPQVMRFRFKMDNLNIAKACLATENQTLIYHCIDSIGYYVGQTSGGSADKIISECKALPNETAQGQCAAAAAGEIIFQNTVGWSVNAPKVCDSFTGELQTLCKKRVDNVKQSYKR